MPHIWYGGVKLSRKNDPVWYNNNRWDICNSPVDTFRYSDTNELSQGRGNNTK